MLSFVTSQMIGRHLPSMPVDPEHQNLCRIDVVPGGISQGRTLESSAQLEPWAYTVETLPVIEDDLIRGWQGFPQMRVNYLST